MIMLTTQAVVLDSARDAIDAISAYEATITIEVQYEVKAAFGAPGRTLIGYQARVIDLDGFGLGYLTEA